MNNAINNENKKLNVPKSQIPGVSGGVGEDEIGCFHETCNA